MIGSFTEVQPLYYWVQHILPLVYDDSLSYMELLGKVTKKLNELVENNNLLPDYIMELIKEYISSGEIEKVLAEVLANYMLNVKFPPKGLTPAVGDGSADDTAAIQGCIDYAYQNGGMAVYFPSGSYLTQPLTLNEKVTLFGQDRYTTRLVMKGGATQPMFTGTVDEMTLSGLGFDGNMDIQVNNVNLFTITVNSAIITNVLMTDGYDLLNITVNKELQLSNVLFRHAVENGLVVGGAGYVQADNIIFKSLSTLIGKNYVILNTNDSLINALKCDGAAPTGILITGNHNVVNMWKGGTVTPYVNNGINNSVTVYDDSELINLTGNAEYHIGGTFIKSVISDYNLSVAGNIIETVTKNKTETIRGARTNNVTGLYTEKINGNKILNTPTYQEDVTVKTVNATSIKETLKGEKNVTAVTKTENYGTANETVAGNKSVTAANLTTTIAGDNTINGGDVAETLDNKTTHTKQDLVEQVDGNKTETVKGNKGVTITGGDTLSADSVAVTANPVTVTADTVNVTANNGETHRGKRMSILTNEAMQYSKPIPLTNVTKYFDAVPMYDVDNVGYNLVAFNASSASIDKLLDDYYADVTDYGADNTGVNDSTAAVQAALDSGKGTVVFPPGNYIVTWARIPSNTHLIGYGASLTTTGNIIFCNKSDGVTGGWVANQNITIEGFDFHAENAGQCTPCGFGHMTNLTIKNCTFHDIRVWHFIEINSCKTSTIDNCKFWNYGTTAGGFSEMVQLDYMDSEGVFPWFGPYDKTINQDIKITNCTFLGTPSLISGNVPAGIGNHSSDGVLRIYDVDIANCYFEGLAEGLKFINGSVFNFHDNIVNGCGGGAYFGGIVSNITIASNYLNGMADYGIISWRRGIWVEYVNGANDTVIHNNYVSSFGNHGITIQGSYNKINDNVVIACGGHGIYAGYNEFASQYSNNQAYANNRIANPDQPNYDFRFWLTRANAFPDSLPVGDIAISNNKFSSAYLNNTAEGSLLTFNKCYFFNNFVKNNLVKTTTVVLYDNNFVNFLLTDVGVNSNIGKYYQLQPTAPAAVNAKEWTNIISMPVTIAGVYSIDAFIDIDTTNLKANAGSVRIGTARNSFEFTADVSEVRHVYTQISCTRRYNVGDTISFDIWSKNAMTAELASLLCATIVAL